MLISTVFASLGYVAGARLQRDGYSAHGTTFWGVGLFALLLLPLAPFALDFDGLATAGGYDTTTPLPSYDSSVRIWDVETGATVRVIEGHANSVESIAFSPDGRTLATVSRINKTRGPVDGALH